MEQKRKALETEPHKYAQNAKAVSEGWYFQLDSSRQKKERQSNPHTLTQSIQVSNHETAQKRILEMQGSKFSDLTAKAGFRNEKR